MKTFSSAYMAVLPFLLLICLSNARIGPRDYWNAVMNGDAMPQVVKDLLHGNQQRSSDDHHSQSDNQKGKFIKDFDTKPNVIIYHKEVDSGQEIITSSSTEQKFLKDFDTKPNVIIYHNDDVDSNQEVISSSSSSTAHKFLKNFDTKPNVIIYHEDTADHEGQNFGR